MSRKPPEALPGIPPTRADVPSHRQLLHDRLELRFVRPAEEAKQATTDSKIHTEMTVARRLGELAREHGL